MPYSETARKNMITNQLAPAGVNESSVAAAFLAVSREVFLPEKLREAAYIDEALPLGQGRFLMEPRLHAKMLQAAKIKPTDRVLDIACGTGYSSALLCHLAKSVVAVESAGELAELARRNLREMKCHVELFSTSLAGGYSLKAPYDVIFINGAVEVIPDELVKQLAPQGRIYAVYVKGAAQDPGYSGMGQLTCWSEHEGELHPKPLFDAAARLLEAFGKKPEFRF